MFMYYAGWLNAKAGLLADRSGRRDKTLKTGTVPPKTGRMVSLALSNILYNISAKSRFTSTRQQIPAALNRGGQYRVKKYRGIFLVPVPVPSVLGTEYRYRGTFFIKYHGTSFNFKVIESFFASIATCFCFSYRLQLQSSFLIYSSHKLTFVKLKCLPVLFPSFR